MELTRKQIISNLSSIMDSMPDDACGDWRDSLAFAIKSIKVDEVYQIMYEGGSIFTSDEVIDMLEKMKKEIEELEMPRCHNARHADGCVSKWRVEGVIQQKINKLKENT